MGKKSPPKAPAPPDPTAVANAQAQANTTAAVTQANLNRIDQYTPEGSLTYQQIGTWPDGTPRYQQTQQYSPEQQALYTQQNQVAQSLGGLAQDNISRVAAAQSQPFNFDGMQPLSTVGGAGQGLTFGVGGVPNLSTSVGNAGQIQSSYNPGGGIQSSFGNTQVQQGLDYGGSFNPGDFNATAKAAADSVYSQAASRLDPRFSQQESDMRARLANSGISENSDAYRREMDNFNRTRNDAYNQAAYSSIGAGLDAQQQGYGQALGTRQQNTGEITTQGQFANSAAGQQYQQNMGAAAFGNDAQAQANQQNMQQAAFGNAAQEQQFAQNLASQGFSNDALAQIFGMRQTDAAFNNQTQNQAFNQQLAGSQFNNQVRGQQIDEASYLRNLPLNDIVALLGTGGGVQQPNFNPVAQVGVAAPDYQGAVYQNYNAAMGQYNQAQANRSAGLGSIFGLAGSLAPFAFSDERLKHGVRAIGKLANGLTTYVFSYLGETARRFGVMAQEAQQIVPDAVIVTPSGYLAVDYRKVW